MENLPPLHAQIKSLWAPSAIYEAGNPRQRKPLPLYDTTTRRQKTKREQWQEDDDQSTYAARRDLTNVLRGTSTRMVWDYQAEAATLSEEEQEYEAQLERIRTHGYSWMVPEGKQLNQEAEADDEAINEEARATAAAAAAHAQRDANVANASAIPEDNDEVTAARTSRRRAARRSRDATGGARRRSGTSGEARGARTRPRSSTASGSGIPPNSRDRQGHAPPRAAAGRYSISSSNGGNVSSVPLPRYGVASTSSTMSRTGRTSGEHARGEDGERDLDAEIPDASGDIYGNDESNDPADTVQNLEEDDDIFTDPGEEGSETDEYATSERRARRQSSFYDPPSPASEGEDNENRENEDSTDMDVSN